MAHRFPKDRYDDLPRDLQRVGAHRAPHRRGRGWIAFGWCALATIVLVGAGTLAIFSVNGTLNEGLLPFSGGKGASPSHSASPTPSVTPRVDPELAIVVLNGTNEQGLAGSVAQMLQDAGWKAPEPANASETNIESTTVYYADPANESAGLALADALKPKAPKVTIQLSDNFAASGAALTAVLGADYGAAS